MLLLVAFVLFGTMLSATLEVSTLLPGVILAVLVVAVIRPAAVGLAPAWRGAVLSRAARAVIAWAGPRGLTALLLALLVVQDGVPVGERIVTVVGWVVVVSVVLHGVSASPVAAWYDARAAATTLPESREGEGVDVPVDRGADAPRIEVDDLVAAQAGGEPWMIVDVRTPGARGRPAHDPPTGVGTARSTVPPSTAAPTPTPRPDLPLTRPSDWAVDTETGPS